MVIKMSKPVAASGGKTDELHLPRVAFQRKRVNDRKELL